MLVISNRQFEPTKCAGRRWIGPVSTYVLNINIILYSLCKELLIISVNIYRSVTYQLLITKQFFPEFVYYCHCKYCLIFLQPVTW